MRVKIPVSVVEKSFFLFFAGATIDWLDNEEEEEVPPSSFFHGVLPYVTSTGPHNSVLIGEITLKQKGHIDRILQCVVYIP